MIKEDEGNETMRTIASHVREGAMAYLKQQYKIVGFVFLVPPLILLHRSKPGFVPGEDDVLPFWVGRGKAMEGEQKHAVFLGVPGDVLLL